MALEPEVQVRTAVVTDDAVLTAIDAVTWTPEVTPGPQPDGDRDFFGGRTMPEDVLVAEVDGRVVGYVSLTQTIPLPSHEHVREINGLAVAPEAQGRGVGAALLEAAKQEARRRGIRKLSLRVLATNSGARRLYESAGFTVEGILREEFRLDGTLVDDVLMAWWSG